MPPLPPVVLAQAYEHVRTPLWGVAAREGKLDVVELLADRGGSVNYCNLGQLLYPMSSQTSTL